MVAAQFNVPKRVTFSVLIVTFALAIFTVAPTYADGVPHHFTISGAGTTEYLPIRHGDLWTNAYAYSDWSVERFSTSDLLHHENAGFGADHTNYVFEPGKKNTAAWIWWLKKKNSKEFPDGDPVPAPEPASFLLLGSSLAALAAWRKRAKRSTQL